MRLDNSIVVALPRTRTVDTGELDVAQVRTAPASTKVFDK
jgi:hypothetical protein